jgi:hypothetical protein
MFIAKLLLSEKLGQLYFGKISHFLDNLKRERERETGRQVGRPRIRR